jgi:hypothetical protein
VHLGVVGGDHQHVVEAERLPLALAVGPASAEERLEGLGHGVGLLDR